MYRSDSNDEVHGHSIYCDCSQCYGCNMHSATCKCILCIGEPGCGNPQIRRGNREYRECGESDCSDLSDYDPNNDYSGNEDFAKSDHGFQPHWSLARCRDCGHRGHIINDGVHSRQRHPDVVTSIQKSQSWRHDSVPTEPIDELNSEHVNCPRCDSSKYYTYAGTADNCPECGSGSFHHSMNAICPRCEYTDLVEIPDQCTAPLSPVVTI